jgi:hypothetical protein
MQLAMMMLLDGMMVGGNDGKGEREEMERIFYCVGLFSFPEALSGSFRSTSFGHKMQVRTALVQRCANGRVGRVAQWWRGNIMTKPRVSRRPRSSLSVGGCQEMKVISESMK